jgi:mannose-1-phosphate guanylyltransferase
MNHEGTLDRTGPENEHAWALVLAGGESRRWHDLSERLFHEHRPKQFCCFGGSKTLLAQTLDRLRPLIPIRRTLVSLQAKHYRFFEQESELCPSRRVVQPMDKGTAPVVIHALLSVGKMDSDSTGAVIAILPSSHWYSGEQRLRTTLARACRAAAQHPTKLIVLGAPAETPDSETGWVDPSVAAPWPEGMLHRVRRLAPENVTRETARVLMEKGAACNMGIVVGTVGALLEACEEAVPETVAELRHARRWTGVETHVEYSLYMRLANRCFWSDVLAVEPSRLLLMTAPGCGWSSLGNARDAEDLLNAKPKAWVAAR